MHKLKNKIKLYENSDCYNWLLRHKEWLQK
uniref:Uncharacterized protein n=1 Tax=Siphoviridae sp. ctyNQ5 TaxID=2825745 RepID=A0A8S5QBY5_9CAUD|nr:MAG TPA: hypothetical protein [Siphoviridae sp. ctyNQ5]